MSRTLHAPTVDMYNVRRALIIKLSALGDIIHALPVSAAIGESYPHVEITWAVEDAFAPLVEGNPYVHNIIKIPKIAGGQLKSIAFRKRYFGRLRAVRRRRFDLTIDLQGLAKSAVIAVASGADVKLGYHWLREASGLVERPVPKRPQSAHVVDQYLDVAWFLGARVHPVRFPFYIPEAAESSVREMLRQGGIGDARYIAVNPGSAVPIKQWGVKNYAALLDAISGSLGMPCVLVTADLQIAASVAALAERPFLNLAGKTSLKQLAAVLRMAAVHVCGDTGSGHMAAALGTPVVALLGPTDLDRVSPYGPDNHSLCRHDLCGPGCKTRWCEYGVPRCLASITVSEVLSRVMSTVRRDCIERNTESGTERIVWPAH